MGTTVYNERTTIYDTTVELVTENCYKCAMPFAIPRDFRERRMKDHETFHCPAGHGQHFIGKSKEEKLAEEKAALERQLKYARDSKEYYEGKYNDERRSKNALKGVVTKKRQQLDRVKNGVCPCCTRSFQNLARHMENKHPQFQKPD